MTDATRSGKHHTTNHNPFSAAQLKTLKCAGTRPSIIIPASAFRRPPTFTTAQPSSGGSGWDADVNEEFVRAHAAGR